MGGHHPSPHQQRLVTHPLVVEAGNRRLDLLGSHPAAAQVLGNPAGPLSGANSAPADRLSKGRIVDVPGGDHLGGGGGHGLVVKAAMSQAPPQARLRLRGAAQDVQRCRDGRPQVVGGDPRLFGTQPTGTGAADPFEAAGTASTSARSGLGSSDNRTLAASSSSSSWLPRRKSRTFSRPWPRRMSP